MREKRVVVCTLYIIACIPSEAPTEPTTIHPTFTVVSCHATVGGGGNLGFAEVRARREERSCADHNDYKSQTPYSSPKRITRAQSAKGELASVGWPSWRSRRDAEVRRKSDLSQERCLFHVLAKATINATSREASSRMKPSIALSSPAGRRARTPTTSTSAKSARSWSRVSHRPKTSRGRCPHLPMGHQLSWDYTTPCRKEQKPDCPGWSVFCPRLATICSSPCRPSPGRGRDTLERPKSFRQTPFRILTANKQSTDLSSTPL